MSRYTNPGPVRISVVEDVCGVLWGAGSEGPLQCSLLVGSAGFNRGAPSAAGGAHLPASWGAERFQFCVSAVAPTTWRHLSSLPSPSHPAGPPLAAGTRSLPPEVSLSGGSRPAPLQTRALGAAPLELGF